MGSRMTYRKIYASEWHEQMLTWSEPSTRKTQITYSGLGVEYVLRADTWFKVRESKNKTECIGDQPEWKETLKARLKLATCICSRLSSRTQIKGSETWSKYNKKEVHGGKKNRLVRTIAALLNAIYNRGELKSNSESTTYQSLR